MEIDQLKTYNNLYKNISNFFGMSDTDICIDIRFASSFRRRSVN